MKSEYIDMFDTYFSGMLTEQERMDFETRLKSDSKLDQAFQEYSHLRRGIDYSIMKSLKEELQELEASLPEIELEPDVKRIINRKTHGHRNLWWRAAAIIVIVAISATVLLLQMQRPSNPQDLFSQHFEPYENQFVSAKRGDDIASDPLVQAFQAYDAGDYAAAVAGFESILGHERYQEENNMLLFFMGSAQLAQDQSQQAIITFEQFLEQSGEHVAEAKWYLALSYLNENRVDDAQGLLVELRSNEKYEKEADSILKQLK